MTFMLGQRLEVIERVVQSWMDFDREQRAMDGLTTDEYTQLITPQEWPTHGMLAEWVKAIREAREDYEQRQI